MTTSNRGADPKTSCTSHWRYGPCKKSCVDALAEGLITASDLCAGYTGWFVDALNSACTRPLNWHPAYDRRRAGE
jgi:hypothetical protein